jgi:iron only hydrogenase large subunit-like protein/nitrogen-specific signal transduction histidine kinase
MKPTDLSLVSTIRERCRVCYTCVRECPAKAIRIAGGQAEVIPSRCIGCGSCVLVCSQGAKRVLSSVEDVNVLLRSGARVAACVAPSFPAEIGERDVRQMVGALRRLGFSLVCEVAFGADLVAHAYRDLLAQRPRDSFIATACPAIVNFVERYHPDLMPHLAPIASPMLATARALRARYGTDTKIVFIGPCIAKKGEAATLTGQDRVDAVLTFRELRDMLDSARIAMSETTLSDFDPPRAGLGGVFPLPRGSLQTAGIDEDLTCNDVVSADGRAAFPEALQEFSAGALNVRLLELLCCRGGCVMGAGMSVELPPFARRAHVSRQVQSQRASFDRAAWSVEMEQLRDLPIGRSFQTASQTLPTPSADEIRTVMIEMGKFGPDDELNCGACGYDTCRAHAVAILRGLAEDEMCLPYTIERLKKTVQKLDFSNTKLASTQQALVQAEKLASMGQLAAGIAHEVNNPLGVVLLYAHVLLESCDKDLPNAKDLAMIVEQADRCKKIVSGLLNFARQNKVVLLPTRLADLVARSLRGVVTPAGIEVVLEHQDTTASADLDADQIRQVLTNLLTNAVAAMPAGGRLTVRSGANPDQVWFAVEDTGVGIPKENVNRVFEPFFTTKQMGRGTGLGLAVSYGIVKMHRGNIRLKSNADAAAGPTGTTFTVTLPRFERREESMSFLAPEDEGLKDDR